MARKKGISEEDVFLEKAVHGDRIGLEYLVSTYKDMAYTVAFRVLSNKEDAEEIVQDSFMRAFASLGKFRRGAKFSTWLYRIVYNASLTKLKNRKLPMVDLNSQLKNGDFISPNTEYDLLQNEERKKYVGMALSKLTHEDFLVVSFFYIGEKSISEIREILGLKRSAIKMRLLRAKRLLETELKKILNTQARDLL